MTTAEQIQTTTKRISELQAAVANFQAASRAAALPGDELRQQFGPNIDGLQEALQLRESLAQAAADEGLSKAAKDLVKLVDKSGKISIKLDADELRKAQSDFDRLLATVETPNNGLKTEEFRATTARLTELTGMLGFLRRIEKDFKLVGERGVQFAVAFSELKAAEDLEQQKSATAKLVGVLAKAKENAGKLTEENRNAVKAFVDAFVEAKMLEATIAGFPGKIDAATSSACQLALKLAAARRQAAAAATEAGEIKPALDKPNEPPQPPAGNAPPQPESSSSFLNQPVFGTSSSTFALAVPVDGIDQQNDALDENARSSNEARIAHQLLTEAEASGVPITDDLGESVSTLSSKYISAAQSAQALAANQSELQEVASQFNAIARDSLGGFINDLRNGTSAADALESALRRIEDRLIDIALNAIFSSSGGGLFGSILGGVTSGVFGFKDGGQVRGFAAGGLVAGPGSGRSDSIPALLSNGEFVANARATRDNRPLLEAINAGAFKLNNLTGFADGGLVAEDFVARRIGNFNPVIGRAASTAPAPVVVPPPQVNQRIINAFDENEVVSNVLDGPVGESSVLNMVRRNPSKFRGALGL